MTARACLELLDMLHPLGSEGSLASSVGAPHRFEWPLDALPPWAAAAAVAPEGSGGTVPLLALLVARRAGGRTGGWAAAGVGAGGPAKLLSADCTKLNLSAGELLLA